MIFAPAPETSVPPPEIEQVTAAVPCRDIAHRSGEASRPWAEAAQGDPDHPVSGLPEEG
jgi:hypothetical protein